MVSDRFRLRYRLTPEHYQTFSAFAWKRTRKKRSWKSYLIALPFGIAIAIGVGLLQRISYLSDSEMQILFIGMVIGISFIALLSIIIGKIMKGRSFALDNDSMIGEFKLAAYEGGGVQISGEHIQSSYDWTAFHDLTQATDFIVMWIGRSSGVIIPNKAFSDDDEKAAFIDFVKERIETFTTNQSTES